jgi:hypothetical protein
MSAVHDVDLSTYCGRIGNLYMRHGLCPPFMLRQVATDWKATGIALSHVVAVIDRHLTDHRRRYYSGSGDALFTWLDEVVRKTWYEQQVSAPKAQSSRPKMQQVANPQWEDREPDAENEVDPGRSPIHRKAPVGGRVGYPSVRQNRSSGASARKVDWPDAKPAKPHRRGNSLPASRTR